MIIPNAGANFSPVTIGYSGQGAFRFWCQTVLPLVYDDSLSYYELLNKVVKYLNNTISDVSAVETNVDNLLTAYNQLQEYVNNYFVNLDIGEEINHKLDEMAADGTLTAIVSPLLPAIISDWLENNITPTTPIVDKTLSIDGAAADAKTVGDTFRATPKIAGYDGGTLLANQTGNTIARISTFLNITDAPEYFNNTEYYGWVMTYGTTNKLQVLYVTREGKVYFRYYHYSQDRWTAWIAAGAEIDATLTVAGAAADAKAVGDEFGIVPKIASYNGGALLANQTTNTIARISSFASVTDAPTYYNGQSLYGWLITYGSVNKMQILYTTRRQGMYVRFYTHSQNRWTDWLTNGDMTTPTYVSIGASTTIGAVHHFTGTSYTISKNNYPAYVGDVLNLNTVNLGQGTTGFIARDNGNAPNFMDVIYQNDEVLSTAALVSIVFGYGNDATAQLPIGEYDDYYPYDEAGYHPSGAAGVTEMLSKGATLMGCLNWCIKWLNEKYPRAQLVIVFGAPSANSGRSISISNVGANLPRKITFTNPFSENEGTASNRGIYKIGQELKKLKAAMNIPIIDTFFEDGIPFSWYSTYARN